MLLALIWGSSFILMKHSSTVLNGWQIGSVRIAAAGLVFLPFGLFHLARVPARKLPVIVLSGLLGNLFPAFLFALAIEKKVSSSLAGILNSLTPLMVIAIGALAYRAPVARQKLIGVLVGFTGLVVLNLAKGGMTTDNFGFISLVLLATVFYGWNVNLVSHHLKGINPVHIATVSLTFLLLPAAAVLWWQEVPSIIRYDEGAWPALLQAAVLGIVGSALATAFFYLLIKRAGGLFASLVTYGVPVVAIGWGIWDGEAVTAVQAGCLGLILTGVYLANRS
ncbi:MAG TPA: DMT family transporter [Chitinophagaceae bacterium]|nr:DMT family transporter [Chitinophagaceae bacterium]